MIDDDVELESAKLLVVLGLRVHDGPFGDFRALELAHTLQLNLEQPDQGEVVSPLDDIDIIDKSLFHLAPEESLESKSARNGIRIRIDKDGDGIFR
jgi:hypothetical protein